MAACSRIFSAVNSNCPRCCQLIMRLIIKCRYLKSGGGAAGYLKHIATREGVEKLDGEWKRLPAADAQKKLAGQLRKDFPDMCNSFGVSQFPPRLQIISRGKEDYSAKIYPLRPGTDLQYQARRPRRLPRIPQRAAEALRLRTRMGRLSRPHARPLFLCRPLMRATRPYSNVFRLGSVCG